MMVQVIAKAYACEKWNKRMIWAVQDVLYRYMQATTKIDLKSIPLTNIDNIPAEMSVLFFVYGLEMDKTLEKFELKLKEIYGGTRESFTRILEPMELPGIERLVELLQQKIQNKEAVFNLSTSVAESLARVAVEIVNGDSTD